MNIVRGNLYTDKNYKKYTYLGFTANSTLKSNGVLVMGVGTAMTVRDKFDGIDLRFGTQLSQLDRVEGFFGIMFDTDTRIFAFQTKNHWRDSSPKELIEDSLVKLKRVVTGMSDKTFALPVPGIGYGGLTLEKVKPLLEDIPDNVTFYYL